MLDLFYILIGKLFALITGGYYFRFLSLPYKLVLFLIAIAASFECSGYYIAMHLHEPNSWLFNLYILIDVFFMGSAAILLIDNRKTRRLFMVFIFIDSIIWIMDIITNSIYEFANFAMVCNLIFSTIMFLIVLFSNSIFHSKKMLKQPVFWLSVSTILYSACDIPYMGLHNYLIIHAPVLSNELFTINTVLDIVRYPLVAISFILLGRQKQVALNAA